MKKTLLMMLAVFGMIFVGCKSDSDSESGGGSKGKTPESAIKAFIKACEKGDAKGAAKYTAGWGDMDDAEQETRIKELRKDFKRGYAEDMEGAEIEDVEKRGKHATIRTSNGIRFELEKEDDGVWRIQN